MLSICGLPSYQDGKISPYDLTDFPLHLIAQNYIIMTTTSREEG